MKKYPLVPLKELLTPIVRQEAIEPEKIYHILGAHWYAQGLYTKDIKKGLEIQAKVIYKVESGDFVYNRLFAWKGSFALAITKNHECYVSNEFPCFIVNQNQLNQQYLSRYFSRTSIWNEALYLSSGGTPTSRNRLKEGKLLSMQIPLPPLDEQRRIVARIEELAAKVEEARGLRRQSAEEAKVLWASSAQKLVFELANKNLQPLGDLVTVRGGGTPSKSNPFFWNGSIPWVCPKDMKILDIKDSIEHISEEATYCSSAKLVEPGCVLIVVRGMILDHTVPSAILRVPAAINQDMKALVPDKNILSEYLCKTLWAMNHLLHELVEKSTHDTRKLETSKLLNFKIPVPPLPEQRRIVAYLDNLQAKVDALKRLQAETAAELDALLPSILDKAFKGEL